MKRFLSQSTANFKHPQNQLENHRSVTKLGSSNYFLFFGWFFVFELLCFGLFKVSEVQATGESSTARDCQGTLGRTEILNYLADVADSSEVSPQGASRSQAANFLLNPSRQKQIRRKAYEERLKEADFRAGMEINIATHLKLIEGQIEAYRRKGQAVPESLLRRQEQVKAGYFGSHERRRIRNYLKRLETSNKSLADILRSALLARIKKHEQFIYGPGKEKWIREVLPVSADEIQKLQADVVVSQFYRKDVKNLNVDEIHHFLAELLQDLEKGKEVSRRFVVSDWQLGSLSYVEKNTVSHGKVAIIFQKTNDGIHVVKVAKGKNGLKKAAKELARSQKVESLPWRERDYYRSKKTQADEVELVTREPVRPVHVEPGTRTRLRDRELAEAADESTLGERINDAFDEATTPEPSVIERVGVADHERGFTGRDGAKWLIEFGRLADQAIDNPKAWDELNELSAASFEVIAPAWVQKIKELDPTLASFEKPQLQRLRGLLVDWATSIDEHLFEWVDPSSLIRTFEIMLEHQDRFPELSGGQWNDLQAFVQATQGL